MLPSKKRWRHKPLSITFGLGGYVNTFLALLLVASGTRAQAMSSLVIWSGRRREDPREDGPQLVLQESFLRKMAQSVFVKLKRKLGYTRSQVAKLALLEEWSS